MKITRTSEPARTERTQPNSGGATRTSGSAAKPAAGSSASVRLSEMGRLSQLESQFSESPIDAAKVSEVRSAIAEGRYQVNAGVIADKLLASAADLAGRKA